MKKDVSISVIMSVYNAEKYLKESVESILNQTFADFEFIIIDDCSTDNSGYLLSEYAKKDDRIKLHFNSENIGLIKSLNKMLNLAKGKYIARMDSDDIAFPERFEKQIAFLNEFSDVYLVGTQTQKFYNTEKLTIYIKKPTTQLAIANCIEKGRNPFAHPTIMFRNTAEYFYREKMLYVEDYDLYLQMYSDKKKLLNLDKIYLKYRLHKQSISIQKSVLQMLFHTKAFNLYKEKLNGHDNYDLFNPDGLLSIDIEKSMDKNILAKRLEIAFKFNRKDEVRFIYKKYIKKHGVFNKWTLYYILNFFPNIFINKLRELIWN